VLTIVDENDFHSYLLQNNQISHLPISQLLFNPSKKWVSNVDTKMHAIIFENQLWPMTVNRKEYQNALVCSPYTTYVTYPKGELKKFTKLWIKAVVLLNIVVMSVVCRLTKFNQVIQVNNNLNSLIKHPQQFSVLLPALTEKLIFKYPKHAITFFRVNGAFDKAFLKALTDNGYLVFPDRAAHVFFPNTDVTQRSHTKRDLSLLRKSHYMIVPHEALTADDAERLAELYYQLFIDKHSQCNPIYTVDYFREAIQYHWHHYTALRNSDGRIDAFISWFEVEKVMVCGPLGYDSIVDRKMGLYRQLVALCLQHANQHQIPFNMGGGSDEFKSNRGSTETMEYTAVYCKHLPFYRQIPWKMLHWACNKLIKKIVDNSNF